MTRQVTSGDNSLSQVVGMQCEHTQQALQRTLSHGQTVGQKDDRGLDVLGTDALGAQKRSCLKYNLMGFVLFFNCLVAQTLTTKT